MNRTARSDPTKSTPRFAIVTDGEFVTTRPNGASQPCNKTTVTAVGWFTTNGAGGTVTYAWIRTDAEGNRWVIAEPAMTIAPGDRSVHLVQADSWTPQSAGAEQLVFYTPTGPVVAPMPYTCSSSNQAG